jgi:hypothetical protein
MAKRKGDVSESGGTVGVFMRLPVEVVEVLDSLAESTSGSRGSVVSELVSHASLGQVREVVRTYRTVVLSGEPERREPREVVVDE